jgi:alanine racemase
MQKEVPGRPWQVRQTTLEIDLNRLKKNFQILAKAAKGRKILVLLKSDAYGHSHREISKALDEISSEDGLHGFGVANVEEGIELRREGIRKPVFVMSGIQHYNSELDRCISTCDLIPVISSMNVLEDICKVTKESGTNRLIHLKFNTGMNRLGIDLKEVSMCIQLLQKNPQIKIDGLMSHLAIGENRSHRLTKKQVTEFEKICSIFEMAGIRVRWRHLNNSAGLNSNLFPAGNLVRLGLAIYGAGNRKLHPVARWTAQVYQIRNLEKGESVGYGATFIAKKKMKMAVLGVGYGDGYKRIFSNRAEVLIQGKRCKVIGNVSMDLTMVDVSHIKNISTEDRAVLLGADRSQKISAEELAKAANSISWEILTGISPRVPRVFV